MASVKSEYLGGVHTEHSLGGFSCLQSPEFGLTDISGPDSTLCENYMLSRGYSYFEGMTEFCQHPRKILDLMVRDFESWSDELAREL
jgi:hypothetical protein